MSNLLSDSSESFLSQPWGLALFIIIDIAVLVLILALNYKWCCKRILDILFSFLGLAVLFPFFFVFWIVQFAYNKKTKAYPSLFVKRYFIGKKEKFSYKTEFACEDADGSVTGLGKAVRACKIAYYPYLADVFCGRLSFIGPVPMRAADSLAVKGAARVRAVCRYDDRLIAACDCVIYALDLLSVILCVRGHEAYCHAELFRLFLSALI